jgi:MFS transporter, AAHS family, 4-hydroxybenzoate transporter
MANTIDIKVFIDERRISAFQWFLVAMCFLAVVADGMDVAIMGFVTPPILQEWNISRPAFGFVISAAAFGLVIGALVAGPSSDRFGRKAVLTASVFVFGLFTVLAAYSPSAWEMWLCASWLAWGWARPCPMRRRSSRNTRPCGGDR